MTFEVKNLSYRIHKRSLINHVSLTFTPGILYGILGPNGSGKSTLLKAMSRIWNPTEGELHWQGNNLLQLSRLEMSRTLSLVPQNPQIYFDYSVSHMVLMGCYSHGTRSQKAYDRMEEALEKVNASHLRDRPVSQLSGGERQKVYIARALATQAPILLLDEPTSHLDLRHQLEIWQLLRSMSQEGKLVIVAVHDLLTARRFCDQLIVLHQGRCWASGSYHEVMTPNLLNEVFGVAFDEQTQSLTITTNRYVETQRN